MLCRSGVALPVFSAFRSSTLAARRTETAEHVVFGVASDDAMRGAFRRAGQFVKMRVRADEGAEHEGIFAIASAPFEPALSFLVRTNNPAGGEAADRIATMPIGTPIEVTLPAGEGFALESARGRDLAMLAVGTALAPVRSALEVVLRDRKAYGALSLDYGLRSPSHLPFAADVERWRSLGVDVALHVGTVPQDGSYEGVRAPDALFDRLGPHAERTVVLAVGHDALVREVRARHAGLVLHNY